MGRHSLVELEAVIALARQASFRKAALELGMSSTALSNAIGKIERLLGVRLFNRTTRSVSLTDAGRNFVEQITPAMKEIHEAMEGVRSQQETPSGVLRINAFATAAREILPLVLTFVQRHPQVHVDLVTEGRLVDIVADGFDFGLRSADLVPSDMIAVKLGSRRFAVVASPGYFGREEKPVAPPDLLNHSCLRIRLPDRRLYPWHFEKDGQTIQVDVKGPLTFDEASLSRIAVLEAAGIGFFMDSDVRDDIASGRLVQVLEDWTSPLSPLCLYYPDRRNPSAAFRAFVEMAREFARTAAR